MSASTPQSGARRRLPRPGRRAALGAAAVIAVSAAGYLGTASAAAPPAEGCPDAEVILIRGTGEAAPAGAVVPAVAQEVTAASAKAVATFAVDYPAANDQGAGLSAAVNTLTMHVNTQLTACPNEKFAVVGYEQGAAVASVALAGQAQLGVQPAPPEVKNFLVAVVLYDDPTHVAGEAFNLGTGADGNGQFARQPGAMDNFKEILQDYCEAGDALCAAGTAAVPGDTYAKAYNAEASAFIVKQLGG